MKLSEKILTLRKMNGFSQEELAEKLGVSRQAVSRWELGSALPDAMNVLQLSKLFGVSTDYLLDDDFSGQPDAPVRQPSQISARQKLCKRVAACVCALAALGNLVIYILSRIIEVMVPHVSYQNGSKFYTYSSNITGRSYKYFIQTYNLELLTALCWILMLAGLIYLIATSAEAKAALTALRKKRRQKSSH